MFPERLRKLRKRDKLSQFKLGQIVGLKTSSISSYERGERNPETETLSKLADYFKVTTDYLLGRTNKLPHFSVNFIGKNLKILRNNRTYEEYEEKVKISALLLEKYEKEEEFPSIVMIEYLAEIENISVDFFFTDSINIDFQAFHKEYHQENPTELLNSEINNWIHTPEAKEYIEFAYRIFKKGIPRDLLDQAEVTIKM